MKLFACIIVQVGTLSDAYLEPLRYDNDFVISVYTNVVGKGHNKWIDETLDTAARSPCCNHHCIMLPTLLFLAQDLGVTDLL